MIHAGREAQPTSPQSRSKHELAVARSLSFADLAAQSGDYDEALSWLDMLEGLGDALPAEYTIKRQAWRDLLARADAT